MKNKIKSILIITASIGLFSSCVNDTFETPAEQCVSPGLTKTKEVADIYAISTGTTVVYPAAAIDPVTKKEIYDYIEAYVISSDEGGNFYKSMYLQPLDGSKGFNISLDDGNIYTKKIQPGKKVFVKLNGLAYANPISFGVGLIFGAPPTDKFAVDRLATSDYSKYIIPSCDIVSEETYVHKIALSDISDTYLNTLVEIDNVQFADGAAGNYYDPNRSDALDSSINITNGNNQLAVRTSRYANFAGYKAPTGNGKIRGVLTKYNSGFQIIIRTERDVKMGNPRILTPTSPIGGTDIQFKGTLSEPFTSYAIDQIVFPNYINDQTIGARYWKVRSFSGNSYLEMTSFGGGGATAKSYFMVPVDFTAANTLSFSEEMRFYKGGIALNVYYVKEADFKNGFLNTGSFVDITPSFNITYPLVGASENSFNSAGTYNIPASITGNGYFVFEYVGTPIATTTVQLDNITIN